MIPRELYHYKQWVCWTRVGRERIKLPISPATGRSASSTDPATWGSYQQAKATALRLGLDGIGFVFTAADPYTGVDLDHCRTDGGALQPRAAEVVKRLNSYTEWSPSGVGLHILVKASLQERSGRRSQGIEIYSSGRYFTITGNQLDGTPNTIADRRAEILDLVAALDKTSHTRAAEFSRQRVPIAQTDEELIQRAEQARNGPKFQRLWAGDLTDYGGDHSRGDAALCSLLAYYTNGDAARIDRLFRSSGLYRPKWDRPTAGSTYGWITIQAALRNSFGRELDPSTLSIDQLAHNGTERLCASAGGSYRQHSRAPAARSSLDLSLDCSYERS
jgi:putative DNA primase/helicase